MVRTVAVVFDLDETLAPDTTTQFLRACGVDIEQFWADVTLLMADGWDQVPAYMFQLHRLSGTRGLPEFSMSVMSEVARSMTVYPGVEDLVERLAALATSMKLSAETYLISSGLRPIVEAIPALGPFRAIWASDYWFDGEKPAFPKSIVSFTDKTRPIVEISKGFSPSAARQDPFAVNRKLDASAYRIPFTRFIFVGDGLTDVPCFAMVGSRGGYCAAVYDPSGVHGNRRAKSLTDDQRVSFAAEADYRPGSDLMNWIEGAFYRMAKAA